MPLGSLAHLTSGASWSSVQECKPVEGSTAVLTITNTKMNGRIDLTDRRYVVGLPESTFRLADYSLVMIRTNGNRTRIGNVYRVPAEAVGSAVSAFQIASSRPIERYSDYLYWVLSAPAVQSQITAAASGTTGLGNIAVRWLRDLDIPWGSPGSVPSSLSSRTPCIELSSRSRISDGFRPCVWPFWKN